MARHGNKEKKRKRGGARRVLLALLGIVLFVAGLALFLLPSYNAYQAQIEMDQSIEAAIVTEPALADPVTGKREKAGDSSYEFLVAYNQSVADGSAGGINDPWGIGSDDSAMGELGFPDSIVGSVAIPSMNVRIPIYFGATYSHMEHGAAVISGTSAPIGGRDSNCVLAAHRGVWHGVPMFRDIESVAVGDLVVIDTPWDTLIYRAVELKVIDPNDVESVSVQPGRDLVTLFSCHPYGHNYQRYLVICERDLEAERLYLTDSAEGADAAVTGSLTPVSMVIGDMMRVAEPTDSPELRAERIVRVAGLALVVLMLLWAIVSAIRGASRRGKERKEEKAVVSAAASGSEDERPRRRGAHFK